MNITVVGTGNMARAITVRLVRAGHDVTLHGKTLQEAEDLVRELGREGYNHDSVHAATSGGDVAGDVIVLAVWYDDLDEVLGAYGEKLRDKIIVDITIPIERTAFEPLSVEEGSAAEHVARRAPFGARVVKAFTTTFAGTLITGEVADKSLDVFVAGDDEDAKWTIAQLIEESGLRAVDAGPLRRARELEALGYLHMAMQGPLGTNYGSAIKLLP